VAAAHELPKLSLSDALDLTLLVARKDPVRHQRVAARWVLRQVEEDPFRPAVRCQPPSAHLGCLVHHERRAT